MKESFVYIRPCKAGCYIVAILAFIFITSCNPTKYVPEGQSLLNANHINVNKEGITKTDLVPYIKQIPNKKIFGTKFYLGLYDLSNMNKQKWPHNWLRNIGEAPVIYDSVAAKKTKDQIKSYVNSKGYFDGIVTDTVNTVNRKSDVYYNVSLSRPYKIHNLTYDIADTNIRKLCYFDSVNCIIERGKPYDVDMLQTERIRFERFIRDHGFYGFSIDYIVFAIDSTVGNRQVDIKYNVKSFSTVDTYNRISTGPFAVYTLKNVYIYPDFEPKEALERGDEYLQSMDTTFYEGYYFISSRKKPEIKYDLILQSLFLKSGSFYSVTQTEQTQTHLQGLKIYRLVNISYTDSPENENVSGIELGLNCNIQLTLLSQQSYKIELEGTNSGGNLGGALNLVYQHKNLFHGAELFSTKLKGAYAAYSKTSQGLSSTEEYGFETNLRLPKFVVPFFTFGSFIQKRNPYTNLTAAYDYQKLPVYTRTVANASFGYDWKGGNYQEHILNPVQFNIVKLRSIDSTYLAFIERSTYLANSYKDVLILGAGYSFIYNNQSIKNSKDYWFLRFNIETSGNLLDAVYSLSGASKKRNSTSFISEQHQPVDSSYHLVGQQFAQYIRTDIDIRYNYKLNDASSIVYRGFFGIGIPYGNSRAVPFEKQYFAGGANDIRAWQVRSLGPGSFNSDPGDTARFLNETSDIKIEANAEYRFKLFWILEGAIFLDAGNIWSIKKDEARQNSQFAFNTFLKEVAIGTGVGFRFDFKFVIARVDVGMKLRNPILPDGNRWIFLNGPYRRDDFTIVLGIGYPF